MPAEKGDRPSGKALIAKEFSRGKTD